MPLDHVFLLGELKRSLQALACDGRQALASVPEGSCKADELALNYSNHLSAALGNIGYFTTEQQRALRRVDDLLSAISGPEHKELWTDEAVCTHPRWDEIRSQARRALAALCWEV